MREKPCSGPSVVLEKDAQDTVPQCQLRERTGARKSLISTRRAARFTEATLKIMKGY